MKKLTTLFVMHIMFVTTLIAQTLNVNYWTFGGEYRYEVTNDDINPNPISPGLNVTWDFSNLTSDLSDTIRVNSNSGANKNFFPNADYALDHYTKKTDNQVLYHYEDEINFLAYLGYFIVGGPVVKYPNPKIIMKFPMDLGDEFQDFFNTGSMSGTSFVKYDGYGKLILPSQTIDKVYRITAKDSFAPTNIRYTYRWFTTAQPVLTISVDNQGKKTTHFLSEDKTSSIQESVLSSLFQIHPNPIPQGKEIKVSYHASLSGADITVFNILGDVIHREPLTLNHLEIKPPRGLYFIRVEFQDVVITKRLQVL